MRPKSIGQSCFRYFPRAGTVKPRRREQWSGGVGSRFRKRCCVCFCGTRPLDAKFVGLTRSIRRQAKEGFFSRRRQLERRPDPPCRLRTLGKPPGILYVGNGQGGGAQLCAPVTSV